MQKQETNVSRGPEKESKMEENNTNFIGEIRKCFFLDHNRVEAKPQCKAAGLRMARETFASASARDKGREQTDDELCLEFVNIAGLFLKFELFLLFSNKALVYKPLGSS